MMTFPESESARRKSWPSVMYPVLSGIAWVMSPSFSVVTAMIVIEPPVGSYTAFS